MQAQALDDPVDELSIRVNAQPHEIEIACGYACNRIAVIHIIPGAKQRLRINGWLHIALHGSLEGAPEVRRGAGEDQDGLTDEAPIHATRCIGVAISGELWV